ncbi:hypothetical protein NPIL_609021 [Nephila pilipes]|uniref:Uncharacterized protein n=1 Tax=Nephila pilipes TaxID=299642 RepID=A0A8X6Q3P3_NEPPI|nr:hypothetical protein NPIL_609021 [Nephila pilipes]
MLTTAPRGSAGHVSPRHSIVVNVTTLPGPKMFIPLNAKRSRTAPNGYNRYAYDTCFIENQRRKPRNEEQRLTKPSVRPSYAARSSLPFLPACRCGEFVNK